jgi:hypothetical protein
MPSTGMLRRVALVRTDISKERVASIIRVKRIGEHGTVLAASSTLMMEAILLQNDLLTKPYGVTSQNTA